MLSYTVIQFAEHTVILVAYMLSVWAGLGFGFFCSFSYATGYLIEIKYLLCCPSS